MNSFQSRSIFKNTYRSDIIRIVIICGGFFVFLWFIETIFKLTDDGTAFFFRYIKNPLLLPLDIGDFLYQPWSLFTYGFIESGFWALLTNMVWVWIFGTVIEDLRGTNRVLPIFFLGSVLSGLALLIYTWLADGGDGLYMSTLGGVAAVAAATITYKPKYVFYAIFNRGVPIYVFGLIFMGLSLFTRLHNIHAILVFLAGGLLGYLSQNILYDFFEKIKVLLSNSRSYFSNNENFLRNKKPIAKPRLVNDQNEQYLNQILDKINSLGIESLSQAERDYLERFKD